MLFVEREGERCLFLGKPKDRLLLVLNSQHHDAYSDFKKTLQTVCCPPSFPGLCLISNHDPVINTAERVFAQEGTLQGQTEESAQKGHSWWCRGCSVLQHSRGAGTALLLPSELTNLCFGTPTALDCTLCLT